MLKKRTIYFIDDMPVLALRIISKSLQYYAQKDLSGIAIHLLSLTPRSAVKAAEREFKNFQRSTKGIWKETLLTTIIPYTGSINDNDAGYTGLLIDDVYNQFLLDAISSNIADGCFSVAVNLVLLGGIDMNGSEHQVKQALAYLLASRYNGRCSFYMAPEHDGREDLGRWASLNSDLTAITAEVSVFHQYIDRRVELLAEKLYALAE